MWTLRLLRLSINIVTACAMADAFGQRLEWTRNGLHASCGGSSLRASDGEDHSKDPTISEFRKRLELSFEAFDGDSEAAMSAYTRQDSKSSITAAGRMFQYDIEATDNGDLLCEGHDCDMDGEECQIPDAFKTLPSAESVDVMSFLGIRRAEPLRVQTDWQ